MRDRLYPEQARAAGLRRLAKRKGESLHKARAPFVLWGRTARYYLVRDDEIVAVYRSLDEVEGHLIGEAIDIEDVGILGELRSMDKTVSNGVRQ